MPALKHVGQIKNTGQRCVIVFREIYDDKGHVIDEHNCLVFETNSLPDAEHQDLMRILESESAQATGDLFHVLGRSRLGTGMLALNWLVSSARLRKFPTDNIMLTPDNNTKLGLDQLNKIVKMQKTGATQADIENMLKDDTDMPPRQAEILSKDVSETPVIAETQTGNDGVLDDATLAKNFMSQAAMFDQQATDLRKQAETLDPSLVKKTRKKPAKKPANKKA